MKRMLIADDNIQIIEILKRYAMAEGYEVYTAEDGNAALEEYGKREYDLILLDVMMPYVDGFEVCRQIRRDSMVPIIMITARGEDYDRIVGLDIGADDYIVKPFSPGEVMARVRAVMRRVDISEKQADGQGLLVTSVGNLRINLSAYSVEIGGGSVMLTKKEIEILWLLASSLGVVFSRGRIMDAVWGYDYCGDSRNVDTHIKRLRAKLENFRCEGWRIETVRGVGYRMEEEHE